VTGMQRRVKGLSGGASRHDAKWNYKWGSKFQIRTLCMFSPSKSTMVQISDSNAIESDLEYDHCISIRVRRWQRRASALNVALEWVKHDETNVLCNAAISPLFDLPQLPFSSSSFRRSGQLSRCWRLIADILVV
jgi:hypothetical protein